MAKKRSPFLRLRIGHASACFRGLSLSSWSKPACDSSRTVQKTVLLGYRGDELGTDKAKCEPAPGNKIMVVVDSSLEVKGALEWALSHAVQSSDSVLLLHVANHSEQGLENDVKTNHKAYKILHSMKLTCQTRRPGVSDPSFYVDQKEFQPWIRTKGQSLCKVKVQVEMALMEGKEKGRIIVEEAQRQKVSLLVLGQKKRSRFWRLMNKWVRRKRINSRTVEYCIQNSTCMTIAVRRKSRQLGGYLITTRSHKKFWLLA